MIYLSKKAETCVKHLQVGDHNLTFSFMDFFPRKVKLEYGKKKQKAAGPGTQPFDTITSVK